MADQHGAMRVGQMAEGPPMRAKQRERLRSRDGDGHGIEDAIMAPGVGLQLPAV
jgi:hypothetical protein